MPPHKITHKAGPTGIEIYARNLEVDMSKPCLRLIHCSSDARPAQSYKRRRRGFRPHVIQGGAIARCLPTISDGSLFDLIDAGLQISYQNYLALVLANLTVFRWPPSRHIERSLISLVSVDLTNLISPDPNPFHVDADEDPRKPR